ncbi:MAG: response regulator [Bacteroidota bacterium]
MQKVILCVDDEKTLLWGLLQQIKRAFGEEFMVELAESGAEALEIINELSSLNTPVFLVITDEMMPGMKGHELVEELKKISPATKCILLSGYAAEEIMTPDFTTKVFKFLKKPWEFDDLIEAIRQADKN